MTTRAPLIGLLVAVLLTVAFWFLLYKPASDEQAQLEQETATLENQQQSLQAEIDQLRDIEANQVEIRAALAQIERFIPIGPAQPTAIRQFQRSADAANVEIISVTFGEPTIPAPEGDAEPLDTGEPGTALANIATSMVVEGGYFQVVDFFRRLEVDVPRAILMQTVAVAEADEEFPTLSTTWTGQLFAIVPVGDIVDIEAGGQAPGASPTEGATPAATEGATPAAGEAES